MATVRDQVEAYNFASRRQVLALLQGDDAVPADPRRRLNRALLGGLLLAVVALAATGVAGFLSGGSSSVLPTDGVIVDADGGGAYVRINDVLHPALNLASAKLIAGQQVTTVSSSALRTLPRGLPVGIPGAPDALPPTGSLITSAWSVCSVTPEASAARAQVLVSLGAPAPKPLPAASGIVARAPDGGVWLLDDGQRYRVSDDAANILRLDETAALAVDPAVLDLVPEGQPLDVPSVPGAGQQPDVSLPFDARVGDVVKVDLVNKQPGLYVVLSDGVAPVDPFAYAMFAGRASKTWTAQLADVAAVPAKSRPDVPASWPRQAFDHPTPPPVANDPFCISYDPKAPDSVAAWPVTFSEPTTVPLGGHAAPVTASGAGLPTAATAVAVPSGGGALVKAVGSGGVDAVYTLVTDSGLRFSITNADAVKRLGYDPSTAVPVPLPFVQLLPAGPGLDPTAAAVEYSGAAEAPAATATPLPSGAPS
jgi:type VII secretion protein EccB